MSWANEEYLIKELFAPLSAGLPGAFGLRDDAACLTPPHGQGFVISSDGIVAGLHLPETADPADVAWKALAVNISDVVAKGGRPYAYLLNLLLPEHIDSVWLKRFAAGLATAQNAFGVHLAGGDTDRARAGIPAPVFSVGITMLATTPTNGFVARSNAVPGDILCVTGVIGDATLGLTIEIQPETTTDWPLDAAARAHLLSGYRRPQPIPGLANVLRDHAHASIDVSDGLLKDAARLCRTSGVGARLRAADIPHSEAAQSLLDAGAITKQRLLSGGEDYCVIASIPPAALKAFKVAAGAIGALAVPFGDITEASQPFEVVGSYDQPLHGSADGWDHLAG